MRELTTKRNMLLVMLWWLALNSFPLTATVLHTPHASPSEPYFSLPYWAEAFRDAFLGAYWPGWYCQLLSLVQKHVMFLAIFLAQLAILLVASWLWYRKPTAFRAFLLALAGVFGGPYIAWLLPCRFFGMSGFWPFAVMVCFYIVLTGAVTAYHFIQRPKSA